jgi:hypothetical protein
MTGPSLHGYAFWWSKTPCVEDTLLVAEVICEQLQMHGCVVIGPAAHVSATLLLARGEELDGAFLMGTVHEHFG